VLDGGTDPSAARVTVPAEVPGLVQLLLVQNVYVTVPVGVNPATRPPIVAVSWAEDPVAGPDWTTVVVVLLVALPTVNGSQMLVEPV
jgi:hypothetical protein